jgi:hypothetical protein
LSLRSPVTGTVFDESIVYIDAFGKTASRNVLFPALDAGLPGLPNQKTLPGERMIRVTMLADALWLEQTQYLNSVESVDIAEVQWERVSRPP